MQTDNPYSLELNQRRRLLADAGFARDEQRIWSHPDGRAAGEGVLSALSDAAFCRFLNIDIPRSLSPEAN
jgi:hypothetical protein